MKPVSSRSWLLGQFRSNDFGVGAESKYWPLEKLEMLEVLGFLVEIQNFCEKKNNKIIKSSTWSI